MMPGVNACANTCRVLYRRGDLTGRLSVSVFSPPAFSPHQHVPSQPETKSK
jgi:hypothetical protein